MKNRYHLKFASCRSEPLHRRLRRIRQADGSDYKFNKEDRAFWNLANVLFQVDKFVALPYTHLIQHSSVPDSRNDIDGRLQNVFRYVTGNLMTLSSVTGKAA